MLFPEQMVVELLKAQSQFRVPDRPSFSSAHQWTTVQGKTAQFPRFLSIVRPLAGVLAGVLLGPQILVFSGFAAFFSALFCLVRVSTASLFTSLF